MRVVKKEEWKNKYLLLLCTKHHGNYFSKIFSFNLLYDLPFQDEEKWEKEKWYGSHCDLFPMLIHSLIKNILLLVAQSCSTLCDPMDCSPPGSSIHGISQARILKWIAISFSKGSSWSRDWTQVFCIAGRFFTIWATREALLSSLEEISAVLHLYLSFNSNYNPGLLHCRQILYQLSHQGLWAEC